VVVRRRKVNSVAYVRLRFNIILKINVYVLVYLFTDLFEMFSVITNIYNKKPKGPTLMELFTATGKLKEFFLTTIDFRCVHRW